MTEMRILTVRQPWAWAIVHGGKDVENRVRNIAGSYRGPVAIHVATAEDESAYSAPVLRDALESTYRDWSPAISVKRMRSEPSPKYLGHIIGLVDLADVHEWGDCLEGVFGCSPWAQSNAHHLVLANPRLLTEPIPFRGALGLRRLDEPTTAQILAQIEQRDAAPAGEPA